MTPSKPGLNKVCDCGGQFCYPYAFYYHVLKCFFTTEPEKYHGVILLPEGLIESIPEFYALLQVTKAHIAF